MTCKQCGKSFPKRTGSHCGGCKPDPCPDRMTIAACRQAAFEGLISECPNFAQEHANFAQFRRVVIAAMDAKGRKVDDVRIVELRPLRLSDANATTEPNERASALFIEAEKLGMEAPTERMVGEAINTAISEVLMWVGGPWHERFYDIHNANEVFSGSGRDDE
jgi:hypothetical protein